jgi:NADPH2:quinone reductase
VEAVNDATDGKGVDIAYDGVGKATFNRTFDCLAQFGTNVLFGWASGEPKPIDVKSLNSGSHQVASPSLGHFTGTRKRLEAVAADLFEAVERGAITVDIGHRYPLAEAARAHADLEARRTTGSIILKA